ncbi:MAG: CAP domain-containing protein [Candidatus Paceibacterota bacterium]
MKLVRRIKHFFIAHKGNRFKPGLFAKESVVAVALVLFLLEAAYVMQVNLVLKNGGFLATVLPAALTSLTNSDRIAYGLSVLNEDPALDAVAQAKADDMAAKGYFAHVSPEGKTPWSWLDAAKYPYTYAGENLAVDFTDSTDVERAWMNSPLHRANILKGEYTHVGIGIAQGMYEGKQVTFIAQFFATRAGEPAPRAAASTAAGVQATPATEPARIALTPEPQKVLGQAVVPVAEPEVPATAAVITTSPTRTLNYVVAAFAGAIAIFFIIALYTHSRRKLFFVEVVVGGLVMIGLAAGIILYNGSYVGGSVPQGGQAASVSLAL